MTINYITINCSGSNTTASLTPLETKDVSINLSYTSSGEKSVTCKATSSDGAGNKSVLFNINGLDIDNYDILYTNISRRIISYELRNNFLAGAVNFSMVYESSQFSSQANLTSGEYIIVLVETNYTTPGVNELEINYSTTGQSERFVDAFILKGVELENYLRTHVYSAYNISFDLKNYWYSGIIKWNITDPLQVNQTQVNGTQRITILNNYSEGTKTPVITAYLGYATYIRDYFLVKPLRIDSFSVLQEKLNSTVSEFVVSNNQQSPQYISWKLATGEFNITSNQTINLSSSVFIYVESNYSAVAVFNTQARVNSTSYNDIENKGVMIR